MLMPRSPRPTAPSSSRTRWARSSRRGPQQHERKLDVLVDRQVRQDVERLEDEAELATPRQRAPGVVERGEVRAVDFDTPRVGAVEAGDQVEQRGLARARLADDRDVFARSDPQAEPVEHGARAEALGETVDEEHRTILRGRPSLPLATMPARLRPVPPLSTPTVTIDSIRAAQARLAGHVENTPCLHSRTLSEITGAEVYLKFENLQFTASFKERGALNKLSTLTPEQKARGVIAVSAGNHAQGVAYHAQRLGIPAVIVMPRFTPDGEDRTHARLRRGGRAVGRHVRRLEGRGGATGRGRAR